MKDDGHPIKLYRRGLCCIGGNWIGEQAKNDLNPLATYKREVGEELSFGKTTASTLELRLLGLQPEGNFYSVPTTGVVPSTDDESALMEIKNILTSRCAPFGTWINFITKRALDAADQKNTREGFSTLSCYWTTALKEDEWKTLVGLQKKFGNLSNESITVVTSLDEILESGVSGAFVHEQVLQQFFLSFGFKEAMKMRIIPHQTSTYAGTALASYDEYLERFEVVKHP